MSRARGLGGKRLASANWLTEDFGIPAWVGVLVRLSDKYSRITRLTSKILEGNEPSVADESLRDTLIDVANYSLLAIILLKEWLKSKKAVAK